MGRQAEPLFLRDNIYYARWYDRGKRIILSLGTGDRIEANRRLPIVRNSRLSWDEYQRTIASYALHPVHMVSGWGPYAINPTMPVQGTREGLKALLELALTNGQARLNEAGEWVLRFAGNENLTEELNAFTKIVQGTNDTKSIKKFWTESVPTLYIDKQTCNRFSSLWLRFLEERKITSWGQINEELCRDFKEWRQKTPILSHNRDVGNPPSILVINRHLDYLDKSFDLAVHKGRMTVNPIKYWGRDVHHPEPKEGLSKLELKAVLNDPIWQHDYLMRGTSRIPLGYKLQDLLILLFVSCKRRGEIVELNISDISYINKYVSYSEEKNKSKGTSYPIRKAFYITDFIERLLKQIVGDRTEGTLFPGINADYFSKLFSKSIERHAPQKNTTLHCLRHSAVSLLEEAGLSDEEIDACLGHLATKSALKFYQDRDPRAVAMRLAGKTKKGIEVLSKAIQEIL
jgi:integrase